MIQKFSTLIALLLLASFLPAQTPVLVKDINPGNGSGIPNPSYVMAVGNKVFFNAIGTTADDELWKTDGTEAGTVRVKDINEGDQGSQPKFYTAYKGELYFTATNPILGRELWRTDENDGALLLAGDICPGPCSGANYASSERLFIDFEGKLYFHLRDKIWVTDGSTSGTMLFKDINSSSSSGTPDGFAVFQGKMYFAADSAFTGTELWVSDGTPDGTHLLKDINSTLYSSNGMGTPAVGTDAFYFWAKDNLSNGPELWKSDGTFDGTLQLKEIRPGSDGGQATYMGSIPITNSTWVGDQLLFTADDGENGPELWITDGTEAGTQLLSDIRTGSSGSNIQFLTTVEGKAYFRANSLSKGSELWVSDGTLAGTQMVKEINPGPGSGINPNVAVKYIVNGNKIYFNANDGASGYELWVTDGTESGTSLVFDLNPGSTGSDPSNFQIMGDNLYFMAETQATGRELWKLSHATSATPNIPNDLALKIYPTLSSDGVFQLQYSGAETATFDVRVFDALGRQVFQTDQTFDMPLRLQHLSAGTYLVRVAARDGRAFAQRVVICK